MPTVSVPAPLGGWNARDAIDAMPPTDAISLINWFPQASAVAGRGGSINKVTISGGPFPIHTLLPYTSATATQMLAGMHGKLYTVDPVAVTQSQIGSGFSTSATVGWQSGHFSNKLVLCNGVDMPQVWDGTTLAAFVGTLGIPTLTLSASTSGGTLAAGPYFYTITAKYPNGTETTQSVEKTVTTTGATSSVTLTWTQQQNATGYTIGRSGTTGTELVLATISSGSTLTYVDTGAVSPSGAMNATDTSPKNLLGVMNMKGRAFYWANTALGFWYAAAGAYQGTLTYFPMELLFQKGGYISLIVSWSRDSGDGVDDIIAFVSSNGEMLVYQGTDPGNALTWSMVGRFHVGSPKGVRSHGKVGSQEILVTSEGFASTDEAIQTQGTNSLQTFAGKITRAASAAVDNYANANVGWECLYYPRQQMFLVNIPIASGQSEQYVRNTQTGAWCRFTGWNANTFCVYLNRLYYGDNSSNIILADTDSTDTTYGWGDNGVAVLRDCTQAYVRLTNPGMKSKITGVQIVSNNLRPTKASVNFFQDYAIRPLPAVPIADNFAPTYWDTSLWDTFYWGDPAIDPTQTNAKPVMYPVTGYGFAVALSYRLNYKLYPIVWYSTNYLFTQAGV